MAAPSVQVTIGFPVTSSYSGYFVLNTSTLDGTAKLAGPVQVVDVSQWLTGSITCTRGRNRETDQFQAGTLTFTLRNEDRRFDPLNTAGPYYPGILPRAPVALYVAGQQIFGGYVDDYDIGYEQGGPGGDISTVTVTCLDGFTLLANAKLYSVNFSAELTGQRLIDILTAGGVSYPAAYNFASGTMTVQASTQDNVAALDHANTIAASEGGWFYIDRTGTLTFQDHNLWPLAAAAFPSGEMTITDTGVSYNGDAVGYIAVGMLSAATLLYNRVSGQRTSGTVQIADDATSQSQYLIRVLSLPTLELDNDTNVLGLCLLYLARYKQPEVRFDFMEVELNGLPQRVQIDLAALDITSVVMAERTPPGGGARITRLSMVERLQWNLDASSDTFRLNLGFADLTTGVVGLILDSAKYGILDTDTLGLGDVASVTGGSFISTGTTGGGVPGKGRQILTPQTSIG